MPPSALAASIIGSVAAALLSCGARPPQPAAPLQAEALSAQPTASTEAAPAADDAFLARCRAAAEYSRKHDGEVLLVLLDGKPVFDDAISGLTVDSPHLLASGTKSFSGIAAALAIEDGLLSLEEGGSLHKRVRGHGWVVGVLLKILRSQCLRICST